MLCLIYFFSLRPIVVKNLWYTGHSTSHRWDINKTVHTLALMFIAKWDGREVRLKKKKNKNYKQLSLKGINALMREWKGTMWTGRGGPYPRLTGRAGRGRRTLTFIGIRYTCTRVLKMSECVSTWGWYGSMRWDDVWGQGALHVERGKNVPGRGNVMWKKFPKPKGIWHDWGF